MVECGSQAATKRASVPKAEREFFDPLRDQALQWRAVKGDQSGLEEMILSKDPRTEDYTRLLRFPPGADTSGAGTLAHDFCEEVWILEGSLFDVRLSQTFTQGMYACRPPGMQHGPWQSPGGALTFEVRYGPRSTSTSGPS